MFFIKTPWAIKKIFHRYTWDAPAKDATLYLTFDDGPHPIATPYALDVLQQYKAKATFFCIGKNVISHPDIYARIIAEGHSVGNHTYNHLNGWQTPAETYIDNVKLAATRINTTLFRPPYGKIKSAQAKTIIKETGMKIIMWDVLSGDFSKKISPEKCLRNVTQSAESGSIIVFHDSSKAFKNMHFALPRVLEHFTKKGYKFLPL